MLFLKKKYFFSLFDTAATVNETQPNLWGEYEFKSFQVLLH